MDRHHILAIKALVIDFLSGYPSLINAGDGTVDAYVRPVMTLSLEAVDAAIKRFTIGEVPGQRIGWPPDATEFYLEAQKQEGVRQSLARSDEQSSMPALPKGCKRLPGGAISIPVGVEVPKAWAETLLMPDGSTTDYGFGPVQLGGLTRREARIINDLGGMTPDGKNFARLTLDQKRDEIARYLPAPVAA